jgi:hypothetical protein
VLTLEPFKNVLHILESNTVCVGITEDKYIEMIREMKGTLYSNRGDRNAYLDEGLPLTVQGRTVYATIRHLLSLIS